VDEAARTCALLLRHGTLPRADLPQLAHPGVRGEVERRLAGVGLVLATSAYSPDVGLRLAPGVTADPGFDAASNLGLKADACVLLVVLWARLVLQKRTAADTRETPGQQALLPEQRRDEARAFRPQMRFETLVREFGRVLGARSYVQGLVTQLRRLGFLAGRGELLEAGPLLELGIDGERMMAFIRRGVLRELLEERGAGAGEGAAAGGDDGLSDGALQLLGLLAEMGGAAIAELEARAQLPRPRLKRLLAELREAGRVELQGEKRFARYVAVAGA
jgi:hypothetical protein